MFELRPSGQFTDREDSKKLNDMGYRAAKDETRQATACRIVGQAKPALLQLLVLSGARE